MFVCNGFMTTITSSFYKIMGEERVTNDDSFLSTIGSISATFNAIGRIAFGFSNDHIGARYSHMIMSCIGIIASFVYYYCTDKVSYSFMTCILYGCIGGMNTIYPTGTANYFGQANFGTIYGCVYVSQVISSLSSSFAATSLKKTIGLNGLYIIVGSATAISLLLDIILFKPKSWRDDHEISGPDHHVNVKITLDNPPLIKDVGEDDIITASGETYNIQYPASVTVNARENAIQNSSYRKSAESKNTTKDTTTQRKSSFRVNEDEEKQKTFITDKKRSIPTDVEYKLTLPADIKPETNNST